MYTKLIRNILFISLLFFIGIGVSYAQPTAGFTYSFVNGSACVPAGVIFNNTSTGTGTLKYEWTFTDGSPSTSGNIDPLSLFSSCGPKTVTLKVTDGASLIDVETQVINIACNPTVDITGNPLSGCPPLNVNFSSANSKAGSGTIASYIWDFCDGTIATNANPSHTFTVGGCYCTKLIITNSAGCRADTTITNYVCVTPPPTAKLTTSNPPYSCTFPYTVNFNGTSSTPTGVTYQWTFNGGNPSSSTSATPSVTYNASGSFPVTLTVTSPNGCTHTITYNNYVNIAVNSANFSASSFNVCNGGTISFTGVPALTHKWTLTPASGFTSTGLNIQDPSFTFTTPGTYNICYDVSFTGGCTARKCTTIVVKPKPTASFTISGVVPTCKPPLTINVNASLADFYSWDFTGGTPSSSTAKTPPTINYTKCGDYSITLVVTNTAGCTDTQTMSNIVKIDCPNAEFIYTMPPGRSCVPVDTMFDASPSTGTPTKWWWNWDWDANHFNYTPGIQQQNHNFTIAGCYTVGLVIENAQGCRDTVTHSGICVGSKLKACFFADDTVACANLPIAFNNCTTPPPPYPTNWNVSYLWKFGDGQTSTVIKPTHTYLDTGSFDVQLIVCNNGCCDTMTWVDYIQILPPIAIINVVLDCKDPFCRTFVGDSSLGADKYLWTFPSGTPSSSTKSTVKVCFPNKDSSYIVNLNVYNNTTKCDNNAQNTIFIRNLHSGFTAAPTTGCAPLDVQFNNTSTGATTWAWRIYDVTNLANPIFVFQGANPGTYTFTTPGVYSVRMVATDINGCKDTLWKNSYITVYGTLVDFSGFPTTGCPPLSVQFTNLTGPSSTATPVSYFWDFGDPGSGALNTSTAKNPPPHVYNNFGSYDITLSVVDNHGCTTTVKKPAYINVQLPQVNFTAQDTAVCNGTPVCFFNLSGGGSRYRWDFGDVGPNDTSSSFTPPCYTYSGPGAYTVKLVATDTLGCTDSLTKVTFINVGDLKASFTADTTFTNCPPLLVSFTNTSTGLDAGSTYSWDLGDGVKSSVKDPQHVYSYSGDFTVKLVVTNGFGCSDSIVYTKFIHIGGPSAKIRVVPKAGCVPFQVCFIADSSTSISYAWNLGDTVIIGGDSVCHTYTKPGKYWTDVLLDDGSGCVYHFPIDTIYAVDDTAFFRPDVHIVFGSGTVNFKDSSRAITPITYSWDFGDPASGANNSSTLKDPSHYYDTVGVYIVTLTATAYPGCVATWVDTIKVVPAPEANFGYTSACVNTPIQFTDSTISAIPIDSYRWFFGDPNSGANDSSHLQNPVHIYGSPNTYIVRLIVRSLNGGTDSVTKSVTVYPLPIANAGRDKAVCSGTSTLLNGTGGLTYLWYPGQTLNDSTIYNPIASPPNSMYYIMSTTDANGCRSTDSIHLEVIFPFDIEPIADTCICSGDKINLTTTVIGGDYDYHYKWSPVQGLSNPTAASPVAFPEVDTRYQVIVYDTLCYSDTDYVTICVYKRPTIDAGDDQSIFAGEMAQLKATSNNTGVYKWEPPKDLTCLNCPDPKAFNPASESFSVTITDVNGCTNSDTVNVFVFCASTSLFIPNAFTPNNDDLNDKFIISGVGITDLKFLRIYDRWGELVFETSSINDGWDGRFRGKLMDAGVFVYYLEATCSTGFTFTRKGNVTLLR